MPVHLMMCARCEAVWPGGCPGAVLQKVEAATLLQATGLPPAAVLDLLRTGLRSAGTVACKLPEAAACGTHGAAAGVQIFMENGTEIPGLERTACVTYERRVPEGALPGAELRAEDLLDISELCKLITQRPDGEAIAHKACPSWGKSSCSLSEGLQEGLSL